MSEETPESKQYRLARSLLKAIDEQIEDIDSLRFVFSASNLVKLEIDYKKRKPWEGKEDYDND